MEVYLSVLFVKLILVNISMTIDFIDWPGHVES
jgi:hypothetical protein